MAKILIYYKLDASSAPRVYKQIDALINHHEVILASQKFVSNRVLGKNFTFLKLSPWKFKTSPISRLINVFNRLFHGDYFKPELERHLWFPGMRSDLKLISKEKFDVLICHHPESLIIASELKKRKGVPYIFNAHEYYPLQFEHKSEWMKQAKPKVDHVLLKYLKSASDIFCVGKIIGDTYIKEFGVQDYTFVPNDKPYYDISPSSTTDQLQLIFHGGCIRGRSIEKTIRIMDYLPSEKFHLNLMLMPTDKVYLKELKAMASNYNNITFIDTVKYDEIVPFINQFDIGLFLIPPTNYNYLNCLPNKLYEYLQAKLCLAVSPNPEMKRVVEQFNLGVISEDYTSESMAGALASLHKTSVSAIKKRNLETSMTLNSSITEREILNSVENLLN